MIPLPVSRAAVAGLATLLWVASAQAEERLPAKMRVTVLLTTLAYDTKLTQNRTGGLKIGVVHRIGDGAGAQEAAETKASLARAAKRKVKGLAVSATALGVSDPAEVERAIDQGRVNVLYLAGDLGPLAAPILSLAGKRQILTLAGSSGLVRAGAAIGVVKRGRKPKILVNPKAAKAQGAQLEPRVLRLVEIVGQ